ncbi:MAG: phenylalanine--tRNA ligase subunit beta [Thermoleophilaceae bacterium]|nr:phenylalanine--tRNA ligase subunit beta [Thermoleophilaceae bacterium]
MRVPLNWLNEYCDSGLGVHELAERLAMTGTEVERIGRHGAAETDGFVVGKVLTREKHPDADKLSVCSVDVGADEPVTIVCGAPNVDAGQTVAVVQPGAVMPDGTKIKKAKLRGVESNGMILSERELEISEDHDGIIQLEQHFDVGGVAAGAPLAEVLAPGQDVLELEITPNRPDCLGVHGVAREVHAITGNPLAELELGPAPEGDETFDITVEDHTLCPRFTARIFRDVKVGPSPLWLKERLSAAGQRPINNVVDITNYVMLLTSQPMHAFDMDKIRGNKLVIRHAAHEEKITTLDDVERTLDGQMLVVCDAEGPTGIAGVMGGQISEVSSETTNVLLEIAAWNGPNIHRTSQKLALRSEASGRFEKGLSPILPLEVQEIASKLMVELTGATLVSSTIDVAGEISQPQPIELREARVEGLLGTRIPIARCAEILEHLDFKVEMSGENLLATPPHYRSNDVTREADLIEEVARIQGVDTFPATLPESPTAIGSFSPAQKLKRGLEDLLAANGYSESITWSFTSEAALNKLAPGGELPGVRLRIANPLSEDQSVMRPLVLGGLLEVAQHNFARGADAVRTFEVGTVYNGTISDPVEHTALALLLSGAPHAASWRDAAPGEGDFFALKGIIEAISANSGVEIGFEPLDGDDHPYLIPGRSATLVAGGQSVGYLGEIHPLVAKEHDISGATAAELNLDLVAAALPAPTTFESFTSFPPSREDIAVVVPQNVPAAEVIAAVESSGGKYLQNANVFDVFEGEQVGEGKKSLAIRLTYAAPDRTLTDKETEKARKSITQKLEEIGGALRG